MMKNILILLIGLQFIISFYGCAHSRRQIRPEAESKPVSLPARDLYLKGLFFQSEGRHNEALVQFYQALHHDSTSPAIYNSIAENHIKLGHYESALILLRNSLRLDANNRETLTLLGDTYFRMRKDDEAIAIYKRLLELNPYHEEARKYLIFLYEKKNDQLNLAAQYAELNELYGADPAKLEKMAEIYIRFNQPEEALRVYQEMLKVDSLNPRVYYLMGNLNKSLQKIDEAISNYQQALRLKPDYYPAIHEIAVIYRSQEDWQKVVDLLNNEKILHEDAEIFPKLFLAESFYYLREYDRAREVLFPLLQKNDTPKQAFDLIARVEFEAKNYPQAKKYFYQIIDDDARNKFAWIFLGFTFTDMGYPDSAAHVYERALTHFPQDAMILAFYGYSLQEQKKFNQAIEPLRQALTIDSLNVNALSSLAVVYENLGMFNQCDSLYEIGLRRFPDNALLLNNYAYSLSERDIRLEEALMMAQKAVSFNPDNAAYLDTIGWVYYKLGQYKEAEKYIRKAVELRDNSAVVLEHMGDVYWQLGDKTQAKFFWQKALDLDTGNEYLKIKLESNE